jgi:hypothetical protein
MEDTLLTPNALAKRWGIKPNTLKQWRWNGKGSKFIKIGGRALYRLTDVEDFEREHLCDFRPKK